MHLAFCPIFFSAPCMCTWSQSKGSSHPLSCTFTLDFVSRTWRFHMMTAGFCHARPLALCVGKIGRTASLAVHPKYYSKPQRVDSVDHVHNSTPFKHEHSKLFESKTLFINSELRRASNEDTKYPQQRHPRGTHNTDWFGPRYLLPRC